MGRESLPALVHERANSPPSSLAGDDEARGRLLGTPRAQLLCPVAGSQSQHAMASPPRALPAARATRPRMGRGCYPRGIAGSFAHESTNK